MSEPFGSISMESVPFFRHTRLYHLIPLGAGTAMVESLTGYISRLAAAHVVSAGALLTEEIFPLMPKGAPVGGKLSKSGDAYELPLSTPHTINGLTGRAAHCVSVLQLLTEVRNLGSLTMLAWKDIFSSQNLLRKDRAWCQRCYAEWVQKGGEAIEPLLWAINAVVVCPDHRCHLSSACPACGRRQPILAGRSRPGCCWRCRKPLHSGCRPTEQVLDKSVVSERDLWIADNVGELLVRSSSDYRHTQPCLQANLKNCVSDLAHGNRSLLLRATRVKEKTFEAWLHGIFLPELPNLLSFCYRLSIPIQRFVAETIGEGDPDWERAREVVSQHAVGKRRSRQEVRRLLEHALSSPECQSLAEIATDLGYRSVVSLRRHAGDLYTMVSNRARSKTKTREPKALLDRASLNRRIRDRLESAVGESKPPSVLSVAKEFGFCDSGSLYCRFPELCKELIAAGARARLEHRLQIEADLRAALVENPAPTLKTIAQRLGRKDITSLHLWFPELCDKLKERWRQGRDERIRAAGDALQVALEQEPTVSADIVAQRHGISSDYLAKLFPEAWRKLNGQFSAAKKQKFAEKREALRREVRRIVVDLCGRGIYPTRRCVNSLLVTSDYRSEDVIASEIDQTVAKFHAGDKRHPRLVLCKRI